MQEHEFREAIRLDPEDAKAHNNLGGLLFVVHQRLMLACGAVICGTWPYGPMASCM